MKFFQSGTSELKFFADRMLGKLARKLRILGFDTLYFKDADENTVLRKSTGRILLTRDRSLYLKAKKLGYEVVFLRSDSWRSQLKMLANIYPIVSLARPFTRCSICNSPLRTARKEEVKGKVPEYIYKTVEEFKICEGCGKIYWRGTHVDLILEELEKTVGL